MGSERQILWAKDILSKYYIPEAENRAWVIIDKFVKSQDYNEDKLERQLESISNESLHQ